VKHGVCNISISYGSDYLRNSNRPLSLSPSLSLSLPPSRPHPHGQLFYSWELVKRSTQKQKERRMAFCLQKEFFKKRTSEQIEMVRG
jgi:hypothetical protein